MIINIVSIFIFFTCSAIEKILAKARQLVDVKKDDGFAALHLASLNGHYLVSKALIEQGQAEIDIRNNRKQTPLLLAVSQGYCGLAELLVFKGANVSLEDEDGDSPLHIILTRHFDGANNPSSQHQGSHPYVQNSVTAGELKKHEHAPTVAQV